ncbi:hypothetical protein JR316_0013493 [Psilocybe cubensis]|uniref:Uncharacterized protein n=2 Tax=Psilocybe cubensis TaxID=181762 RepID=A0ACB8GF13_PSICU|nr:uncharacterized protein JR316_0013489 [Psilocybe cubensis]XP_047741845.1 uncharacterized protein JR316_0013493 [Psilocybe cubensis]KAH9474216.1 hypothetical protein JR316_0013489 [Psilocybe cubensis]KAH9474220.1 hypothetical protein JR316_0013493 [Psilocybe cubensis]
MSPRHNKVKEKHSHSPLSDAFLSVSSISKVIVSSGAQRRHVDTFKPLDAHKTPQNDDLDYHNVVSESQYNEMTKNCALTSSRRISSSQPPVECQVIVSADPQRRHVNTSTLAAHKTPQYHNHDHNQPRSLVKMHNNIVRLLECQAIVSSGAQSDASV